MAMTMGDAENQRMLRDSVSRYLSRHYSHDQRRRHLCDDSGAASIVWQGLADLGLFGIGVAEDDGGIGGGVIEASIMAEEFGRALVAEPYLSALLATRLITGLGSPSQRRRLLPPLQQGRAHYSLSHEQVAGTAFSRSQIIAHPDGTDWCLTGVVNHVTGDESASDYLVLATIPQVTGPAACGLFLVPAQTPGLEKQFFSTVDSGSGCHLTLSNVRVSSESGLDASDVVQALGSANDFAAIILANEAVGCMAALIDATLDHTRTREQFGRPLAANQALRHRLADMTVEYEIARGLARRAVAAFHEQEPQASRIASAAKYRAGRAGRFIAEQAVQLHGGMGVTEELPIGAYLKRLIAIDTRFGTGRQHLKHYAVLHDVDESCMMNSAQTPDDQRFRHEVRSFLDENLSPELRRSQMLTPTVFCEPDLARPYQQALFQQGWAAPSWPTEYGGTGWSLAQRHIFETEAARARAPVFSPLGLQMVGPVIFTFGSRKQKDFYLPRILSGEDYWCQGYSEPGAGSDLAALSTRAVRDGDSYVINGAKIWTTHAHYANRMFALVRTDNTGRKQEGISFVLIDMDTPGITIRPILTIGGDHEVNEVTFEDVRIPIANLVGKEGKGWSYGKFLLEFERGGAFLAARLRQLLVDTIALITAIEDAHDREALLLHAAEMEIDIDALEAMELSVLSDVQAGRTIGSISSILKLHATELRQSITRLGLDAIGSDALVWERQRPLYDVAGSTVLPEKRLAVLPTYLDSRAYTIFGGTSEIQRDIIARAVIGA